MSEKRKNDKYFDKKSDDENLEFNDSGVKEYKSYEQPSKLSIDWQSSLKGGSSDRSPSMGRGGYFGNDNIMRDANGFQTERNSIYKEFSILNNRKIFQEKYIGISGQIQPRRARQMRKQEGYNLQMKKNFILSPKDEFELLDNMLINQKPETLSKMERKVLKIMVKRGLPEKYRKHLWLRASGASASMSLPENKNYYRNLMRMDMNYPNPSFNQIELDLRRTFYELKINKSEVLINKLRNVLATYCKRNPTIGYCQGMNFLVGRLIKVMQEKHFPISSSQPILTTHPSIQNFKSSDQGRMGSTSNILKVQTSFDIRTDNSQLFVQNMEDDKDEEEAFWIFTHMVESLLPIDYYSNMVGVLIDQKIFYEVFKQQIPDLCQHLESVGFDPSLLAFQWLVCMLSYNMPQEVSIRVWDLFFLKGTKIIFRVSLALLHLMKPDLMNTKDFAEIFEILEAFPRKLIDDRTLIQTAEIRKYKVKNRYIRSRRRQIRETVEKELQKLVTQKETFKGTYQRLKFLNKFYLYNGVQKSDQQNSTTNELYYKTLDQYENEVMRIFNCSQEWPICLFDFTYKNKIPDYLCLSSSNDPPTIIEDYFSQTGIKKKEECEPEFTLTLDKYGEGIQLERGHHYCESIPKFIHNFKTLYEKGDQRLFTNQNLYFNIVNEIESQASLQRFFKDVATLDPNNDPNNPVQQQAESQKKPKERVKSFSNIIELDDEDQQSSQQEENKDEQQQNNQESYLMGLFKRQKNNFQRFNTIANEKPHIAEANEEELDYNEDYEHIQQSMTSLHLSALDIVTGNLDKDQAKESCNKVYSKLKVQQTASVVINEQKINDFIQNLEEKVKKDSIAYEKWAKYHIDPNQFSLEQVIAYVFVVDAMNFCFWPNNPSGEFEYEHMTKNLAKILEEQPEFFIPQYLSKVEATEIQSRVFADKDFALLQERARILREIGTIIDLSYEGQFLKFVETSGYDVPTLIKDIVQNFTGFRDEAIYQGEQILFYKRAQILVADLIGALQEKTNLSTTIEFHNLNQITMFADYRVPQILRHVGIFEYSKELEVLVDNESELPYSCTQEVEIRASTVVAVEMILEKIGKNDILKEKIKYAFEVDWLLWQMGENNLDQMKPHHKVLSIFY